MDVRELECFLTIVREGSISRAAEILNVSQPTLSRRLADLEDSLGTVLLARGRHGMALTEDGALLHRRAAEIVGLVHETESELMLKRGVVAGEVRIGCAETRAIELVARVMRDMRAAHPGVRFRMVSAVAEDVMERLNRGLIDFGVVVRNVPQQGIEGLDIHSGERVGVLVRRDSDLAKRGRLAMGDLVGVPLIVPESYAESGLLGGERPRDAGGRLEVAATYTLAYNASRMVRAGLGAAVMFDGLVDASASSGLLFRPLGFEAPVVSRLVWRPFQLRCAACEVFLQMMRERFD